MYRWSLKSNEPWDHKNHFREVNIIFSSGVTQPSSQAWFCGFTKYSMIWRYNSDGILAVNTRNVNLLWVSKTAKNNRGCEGTIQKIWFAGTYRFTYELSTKKSYSLASKYAMSLQKILGVMAQLIKIFLESRVRNRASLLFAFDYLCGWKGKSS